MFLLLLLLLSNLINHVTTPQIRRSRGQAPFQREPELGTTGVRLQSIWGCNQYALLIFFLFFFVFPPQIIDYLVHINVSKIVTNVCHRFPEPKLTYSDVLSPNSPNSKYIKVDIIENEESQQILIFQNLELVKFCLKND